MRSVMLTLRGTMSEQGSEPRPTTSREASPWRRARWKVLPEWRDALLDAQGLPLERWLDEGRAEVVKHGAHRTVYRIDVAERTFFLKHDRPRSWWRVLQHLFRATAARREYRKAMELRRRQVPTIAPVGVGERASGGLVSDNFLLTEAIPEAVSLSTFVADGLPRLAGAEQERLRRRIAIRLAELCAAAHRAGVYHNDLHAGNVLVRMANGEPELYLADLPGVQLSGVLGWKRSRASLVMLNSDWSGRAALRDRWRFWRAYLRARPDLRIEDARQAAAEIDLRTRDYACQIMAGRDKRALATNRDFRRFSTHEVEGHIVNDVALEELIGWLQHRSHLTGRDVYVTEWPRLSWPQRLVTWFRGHPAVRQWRMAHALLARGIATPRPLAVCRVRESGEMITMFEQIPHLVPLRECLTTKQTLAEGLGRLLGRMHAWRISHTALSVDNTGVSEQGGMATCYLLDTQAVKFHRRLSDSGRVRDLAVLMASITGNSQISRTERLRFLRAYAQELKPITIDVRSLWRELTRLAV